MCPTCTLAFDFFCISPILVPPGPITSLTLLAGICRAREPPQRHQLFELASVFFAGMENGSSMAQSTVQT